MTGTRLSTAAVPAAVLAGAPEHVAIVLLAPFASGAEHQTLALCRYLQRRCRVTVLANDEFASLLQADPFLRVYLAGVPVVALGPAFPVAPARRIRGAMQRAIAYPQLQLHLWRALRRLKPAVVHLVLAPTFFAYAPFFRLLPFPTVLTLSGEMRYVRHFYGLGKQLAVRYAAGRGDALVVCSADELENLRAVQPAAEARATVLDNFTDTARFFPREKDGRIVFAGRLHPEKGALLFVRAAARIHALRPAARFLLMGQGEQEAEVVTAIVQMGLENVVQRGFQTDLAPVLASTSIFVSCQLLENLGSSSLLEAMASGNAVVATDVGSTSQIVDEAVGLRVPPDAGALASALVTLLDDPVRVSDLGAAARRRIVDRYGPQRYVDQLLGVYARAGRHRRHRKHGGTAGDQP